MHKHRMSRAIALGGLALAGALVSLAAAADDGSSGAPARGSA